MTLHRILVALLVVVIAFAAAGCTTMTLDAQGIDKPVSMTNSLGDEVSYRVLTNVSGRTRAIWILGFSLAEPDVRDILIEEAAGADAFVNINITTRQNIFDWALATLTGGAITMRTVIVEGTAVEY